MRNTGDSLPDEKIAQVLRIDADQSDGRRWRADEQIERR